MWSLQAVEARIASIRGMVESASVQPSPARVGQFQDALKAALGPADSAVSTAAVPHAHAEHAQLLSRPQWASRPAFTPSGGIPVRAEVLPVRARVSSPFGPRIHPITGTAHRHAGVDFAAPAGTPIRAAAGGVVTFAGSRGGYGNLVIVRHADGAETWYAHQRDLLVSQGQPVSAGQTLGTVGSTGRSTGPHLHFELRRDGKAVDPMDWLATRSGGGLLP